MKRILVSGSEGFIGGHLVKKLADDNFKVIATYLDQLPNSQLFRDLSRKNMDIVKMDVLKRNNVAKIIKNFKPDLIIHLAAKTLVTEAFTNPHLTIETNVLGTLNILEEAKNNGRTGIIFASSDKAYGGSDKTYKEVDPLAGSYPYDVSKSAADLICQSYAKTYHLPIIVARLGNVFGAWDMNFDRLIPGICKAVIENDVFKIRSNGEYVRDYIDINDAIGGYKFLVDNFETLKGESFNISSPDSLSPIKIINIMEKVLGRKIRFKILDRAEAEIPYQHLNWSKIRKLGWRPRYNFNNSISGVFEWYASFLKS